MEFEDVSGTVRRLSPDELLVFLGVIANAGTETVEGFSGGSASCSVSTRTSAANSSRTRR